MRIMYVTAAPLPSYAANGVQVARMCEAFFQGGHQVVLVSLEGDPALADETLSGFYGLATDFTHVRVPLPELSLGRGHLLVLRTLAWARRLRPDLVYTRSLRVAFATSQIGTPTILELHSLRGPKRRDDQARFRALCRSRHLVHLVTISDALRRDLEEAFPSSRGRCVVAHDAATPPDPNVQPMELERHPDGAVVGYVGALYPGRGLEVILRCAERLPDCQFHIAGRVDGSDAEAIVGAERVPNIHMHGYIPPAQTEAFRAGCDILVAPYQHRVAVAGGGGDISRWMSPLKIFEYMASGKPIICSDLPVLREVLAHERTALLCTPDDVGAWVECIERLRLDGGLRAQIAQEAQQQFVENHTYLARACSVLSTA